MVRGSRAHRLTVGRLGGVLTPDLHIHHQDFDKLNACPRNLVVMPAEMNPTTARQCPYTGRFMSADEWERAYRL